MLIKLIRYRDVMLVSLALEAVSLAGIFLRYAARGNLAPLTAGKDFVPCMTGRDQRIVSTTGDHNRARRGSSSEPCKKKLRVDQKDPAGSGR